MKKGTTKIVNATTPVTVEAGADGCKGDMPLQLLSTHQVALAIGVRDQSLRSMRMRGSGPRYVRIGGPRGRACYRPADVAQWLEARVFTSTSEETASRDAKGKTA